MSTYETRRASEMFNLLVDDLAKPPLDAMKAISRAQHNDTVFLSGIILSAWKDGTGDDHFRAVSVE